MIHVLSGCPSPSRQEGCIQVVRFLLDAGSPFDTLDGQRRTAASGIQAQETFKSSSGARTPLLIATRAGNLELCEAVNSMTDPFWQDTVGLSGKVLLSVGADPNTGDMARGIPSALALARRGAAIFRSVYRATTASV